MHADARSIRHFMPPVGFIVHLSLEGHKCRNRDLVPSHWLRGLLFFHRDSDCSVRREANLSAFDFGNQAQVDIMMVAPVPAFTAVDFCQFNPAVFNAIDGSDVYAMGADNLHMLFGRFSSVSSVNVIFVSRVRRRD